MINIHSISAAGVNIFIIYFVLVKNTTLGLNTKSCNHDEIKAHIKDFFDCMYGMKDEKIAADAKVISGLREEVRAAEKRLDGARQEVRRVSEKYDK